MYIRNTNELGFQTCIIGIAIVQSTVYFTGPGSYEIAGLGGDQLARLPKSRHRIKDLQKSCTS